MGVPGNADLLLLKTAAGATGYQVSRSLRFNSADSAYLSRTPASAGNRKTWTWSAWVKRSALGSSQYLFEARSSDTARGIIRFTSSDQLAVEEHSTVWRNTTQVFRDASAWYHLVVAFDTTQSTGSDRVKIYVNGSQVTAFSSSTDPASNTDYTINNNVFHALAASNYGGTPQTFFSGYLADIWFLDGIAATPSDFAETNATTGQWVPKTYSGSKGSNGFHLEFADNSNNTASTLGKDTANSNNWTPNNLSVTAGAGNDSLVDTPTSYGTDTGAGGEVRGNYATLNPLVTAASLNNGNLQITGSTGGHSTIRLTSGKWYVEYTCLTAPATNWAYCGITWDDVTSSGNWRLYRSSNGDYYNGSSYSSYGASWTANDVIGVAVDIDNSTLTFYKNGVSQGQKTGLSLTDKSVGFLCLATGGGAGELAVNFGQRTWAYTPPANYQPVVDTLLPSPSVAKPSTVMDVKLYTGNGSTQTISGLGFSPDLVWIKSRSAAYAHLLYDTVRGAGLLLRSADTTAESGNSGDLLGSFNSDGFAVNSTYLGSSNPAANDNAQTYAAWCWDAGSSNTTNTAGSITSTVRVNATAGFSIITYSTGGTGSTLDTVGHGLGVAPVMLLVKNRDQGYGWLVARSDFSNPTQDYMFLNSTDAKANAGTATWSFSSTTVGIRQSAAGTLSGAKMVVYAFSPVAGYSSFGSYTGNGSADGPFVWCGFRPRWVLVKMSSGTSSWQLLDSARSDYNVMDDGLFPNLSNAETASSAYNTDFLSNGFKIRDADSFRNGSGSTFIYAAFAENPFQYARAR